MGIQVNMPAVAEHTLLSSSKMEIVMNRAAVLIIAALALGPQAAITQKPSLQGGAVVASEPGKVALVLRFHKYGNV
jgi:hypothetical protein